MTTPNIDPTPSPGRNTLERTAPGEFTLRRATGGTEGPMGQAAVYAFQVRGGIPEMEAADLSDLYRAATLSEDGQPSTVEFVSKSIINRGSRITLRHEEGLYIAEKLSEDSRAGMSSKQPHSSLHEFFTLDHEAGRDHDDTFISMGYDADGNPEIIEFKSVTFDDFDNGLE